MLKYVPILAVALAAPANATALFSDLGSSTPLYGSGSYYSVNGQSAPAELYYHSSAQLFTASGTGAEEVAQIDAGVYYQYSQGSHSLEIGLYLDAGGTVGTAVTGAQWLVSPPTGGGPGCC